MPATPMTMDSDMEDFNSAMSSDGFEEDAGSSFGGGEFVPVQLVLCEAGVYGGVEMAD